MTPLSLLQGLVNDADTAHRPDQPLGQILLAEEALTQEELDAALARQDLTGERLGEILVANGVVDPELISRAVASQRRLGYADLANDPPDPAACDPAFLPVYLKHRLVPWRKVGSLVCFATAEPDRAQAALDELSLPHAIAFVVVASQRAIDQALLDLMPRETADRAATLTPPEWSVRTLDNQRQAFVACLAGLAVAAAMIPTLALAAGGVILFLLNALTTVTRLAAGIASFRQEPKQTDRGDAVILAKHRPTPRLSVLIPLYDEPTMIPKIVRALSATDYPRERLDVKLLLEDGDVATRAAVSESLLPPWVSVLILPDGEPRTKPRAMNLALDFCDGDIIGILDAEDCPDPGQFRAVADHLVAAPHEVACVQCQLSWFNARETWITRCFQIEYSIWFDVLLRGFQRLRLPIPLGGTSVYFRRSSLRAVGGWDAHNVTEDADLGMRLARRGLKTEVLTSTTTEEANTRMLPWIRQRSRWLKGYLMTWLSHMRRPLKLWQDLGPIGFLGLNVLFLGGAVTYLAMPVFWAAVLFWLTSGAPVFGDRLPDWAQSVLAYGFAVGQVVMLGCAALALWRRRALDLLAWLPILPIYWTLGAIAAWKAIIEVATAPFYWDKTQHGVSRCDGDASE